MSDDGSPVLNPYATSSTLENNVWKEAEKSYGGIGRLAYFGSTLGAGFVYNVVAASVIAVGGEAMAVAVIPLMLVYLGVLLWIMALRMIHMGYSAWWCLGMMVPLLNILVAVRCIACPEGYADHRTLDTAGKVLVGMFLVLVLLFVAMLFLS